MAIGIWLHIGTTTLALPSRYLPEGCTETCGARDCTIICSNTRGLHFDPLQYLAVNYYKFTCRNCSLTEVPKFPLRARMSIFHLDLAENEISIIREDAFHNYTALISLNLSSNLLCGSISIKSPSLKRVNISNNNITEISNETSLPELTSFTISKNRISHIPRILYSENLEVLIADHNLYVFYS